MHSGADAPLDERRSRSLARRGEDEEAATACSKSAAYRERPRWPLPARSKIFLIRRAYTNENTIPMRIGMSHNDASTTVILSAMSTQMATVRTTATAWMKPPPND